MQIDWNAVWLAATPLLTLGLLVVTGVYAYLTYRLVKSSEQQSWEVSRPRLVVALRTNQGGQFLMLHIENIGMTPADELRLALDRPVNQQFGKVKDIRETPILKEGLPSLPPQTRVRIGIGVAHSYLHEDADRQLHPLSFEVTATYKSGDRNISERFPLDVERQLNATLLDQDYLEEFGRNFPEKFSKEMRDLVRELKEHRKK